MAYRLLNDAEIKVSNLAQQLGRSSKMTGDFFRARVEDFLQEHYQYQNTPDFNHFAVQFCEQIDHETGKVFRDILWHEAQQGKPTGRAWSKNREGYVLLI